jgi:glycerophosphoryl diester phosphodiesterase
MAWRSRLEPYDWRWLIDRPIAHRGLHYAAGGIPENTCAAFAAAIARGFAIECDVQLTADGEAVVFHDDNARRLTGADRAVSSMTLAELSALPIAGTDEHPPSLKEALNFIGGRVPVLIELKAPARVGPLERAVASALESYNGAAAVMSFSPRSVRWFAEKRPAILRGLVSGPYRDGDGLSAWRRFARRNLLVTAVGRPHFVAHGVDCLDLAACRLWRRYGGPLLTWTVRSAEEYARVRPKADGIIFEGFDPPEP